MWEREVCMPGNPYILSDTLVGGGRMLEITPRTLYPAWAKRETRLLPTWNAAESNKCHAAPPTPILPVLRDLDGVGREVEVCSGLRLELILHLAGLVLYSRVRDWILEFDPCSIDLNLATLRGSCQLSSHYWAWQRRWCYPRWLASSSSSRPCACTWAG